MNNLLRFLTKVWALLLLAGAVSSRAGDKFAAADFTKPDVFPILLWDPLHGWDGKARECETPQMLSYDNYMVQYSDDLKDRGVGASYFRNMMEVRRVAQKHGLPYLHIVAAHQLVPEHTIPSPANLGLEAYTTLAAGFRGVTWYTYYDRGYHYALIDAQGRRSLTWSYLREVNRQVGTLAPVLSRLSSTGGYFSVPPPADGLPLLPGMDAVETMVVTR